MAPSLTQYAAAWQENTVAQKIGTVSVVAGVLVVLYLAQCMIYNLYFHGLAGYPGPFWARSSPLWAIKHMLGGDLSFHVEKVHRKYGRVVRIAPDELVWADAEAWKDIYGIRPGKSEIPKDPMFYLNTAAGIESIIAAPAKRHGELRRLLSHGFSERALRSQEPIIQHHVDLFIHRLRQISSKGESDSPDGKSVDIVKWYNFFTFDVIGDLAFASSFGCLETGIMHPWIDTMMHLIAGGDWKRAADMLPIFKPLLKIATPQWAKDAYKMHVDLMRSKALSRLDYKGERLDFVTRMAAPDSGVTPDQFIASADTLLLGGSETTSTLLSGCTYLLLKHPEALKKLVDEIRSAFKSEEEITINSVNSLEYMLACLEETFRLYPPVPGSLPRKTVAPDVVAGRVVPAGTRLSIHQWAINRRPEYFKNPDEYIPERWLGDARFADDNRAAMQPFGVGARNCIGRNLAYAEMRLVLARLLLNFDIQDTPATVGWTKQIIHLLWNKGPLWIKMTPRDVPLRPSMAKIAPLPGRQG